jgi:hypothetical protein
MPMNKQDVAELARIKEELGVITEAISFGERRRTREILDTIENMDEYIHDNYGETGCRTADFILGRLTKLLS